MELLHSENLARLCLIIIGALWLPGLAADWQPNQVRYEVYRNGKPAGQAKVSLEVQGSRLVIRSEGGGTHGLGRFLGINETESVEGQLDGGRFFPETFSHHSRVAGINDVWTARYDWPRQTVTIFQGKKSRSLNLGDGALDDLSLKLEIARRLRAREPDLAVFNLDSGEIKLNQYRLLDTALLDTSLGCIKTMLVERVRTDDPDRFSRTWYAPDLDFVVVRMERGKAGGAHLELRITELVLGQSEVKVQPACAALQPNQG